MADSDSFTTARNEQSVSRPIRLQRPRSSIQTAQTYAKKLNPFIKMIAIGMIIFIFVSNLIKPASDSCAQSPLASSQNKEMMNS